MGNTMPYKLKDKVRHKFKKPHYNKRDWRAYDQALKKRGSLTLWFSQEAIDQWIETHTKSAKKGGQKIYSDLAIEVSHTLRLIYKLGLRQTEGFMNSIIDLLGIKLLIPDHTTLSRRAKTLLLSSKPFSSTDPVHIIIDSTGLKVWGEKEWMSHKHGTQERKVWKKLHLCINEEGEILSSTLTCHTTSDTSQVSDLLETIEAPIGIFMGDGGYDHGPTYKALEEKQQKQGIFHLIKTVIPPNISFHKIKDIDSEDRHFNQDYIENKGRLSWQTHTDYGKRSYVETTIHRYKAIIGNKLRSRDFDNQVSETKIAVQILNKIRTLGIPRAQKSL
jgi:hypothetical protein